MCMFEGIVVFHLKSANINISSTQLLELSSHITDQGVFEYFEHTVKNVALNGLKHWRTF